MLEAAAARHPAASDVSIRRSARALISCRARGMLACARMIPSSRAVENFSERCCRFGALAKIRHLYSDGLGDKIEVLGRVGHLQDRVGMPLIVQVVDGHGECKSSLRIYI